MAFNLSPFSQTNFFRSITHGVVNTWLLRLYSTAVAIPAQGLAVRPDPAGHILQIGSMTFDSTGSALSITSSLSGNALSAGTLSWWILYQPSNSSQFMFSDSIGLSGSGKVITANTMTPSNSQNLTLTFNLSLVQ